jgi:hypothetical protein
LKAPRYIRSTTMLLGLVNLGLAFLVIVLWREGQARVLEPGRLVVPPLTLPDLTALDSPPMSSVDVTTIRNHAVFYARRSFYEPPAPSVEIPPPEYDLAGTLGLRDGKRVAFVKKRADHSSRALHIGDEVESWRVEAIDATRVVLARNEQRCELLSKSAKATTGLIHGPTTPRGPQPSLRVLTGTPSGTSQGVPASSSSQARLYRPPPPLAQ